jgi:hypothetical protein
MAPRVPQAFPIPEGVQRVPVIPFGGDNSFGAFKSNFPTFKYDDPRFLNIFNNSGILGSQPSATNAVPGAAPDPIAAIDAQLAAGIAKYPPAPPFDPTKYTGEMAGIGLLAQQLSKYDPQAENLRALQQEKATRVRVQLQEDMQNRLIARKEEFDKKRDERNLLHQSILNLGNIPRRIVAKQGELMSETGRQLSALTAASLGGQQTSEKPIYQVKQYY